MARLYITLGRVRGEGAWEMIFCPASGYEVQAPEFKQWRGARKHPRYDKMIFAELNNGGIVQETRLDPDPDAPVTQDLEIPSMPASFDPEWGSAHPDFRAQIRAAAAEAGSAGMDILSAVRLGLSLTKAAPVPLIVPGSVLEEGATGPLVSGFSDGGLVPDPAPAGTAEEGTGDAQDDFVTGSTPAAPRPGKPAKGGRRGN